MSLPRYVEATRNATPLPPFQSVMDADLRVPLERQRQSQWCWAAVAHGVAAHFAAPNPPRWKQQCSLVNDFLRAYEHSNNPDCCGPGGASLPCNRAQAIYRALLMAGHYQDYKRKTEFAALQNQIERGQPIVLRIYRTERGRTYYHFVVVDAYMGYSPARGHVAIKNPDQPRHFVVSYKKLFTGDFDSGWNWEYTFFTQRATHADRDSARTLDVEPHMSTGEELIGGGP